MGVKLTFLINPDLKMVQSFIPFSWAVSVYSLWTCWLTYLKLRREQSGNVGPWRLNLNWGLLMFEWLSDDTNLFPRPCLMRNKTGLEIGIHCTDLEIILFRFTTTIIRATHKERAFFFSATASRNVPHSFLIFKGSNCAAEDLEVTGLCCASLQ